MGCGWTPTGSSGLGRPADFQSLWGTRLLRHAAQEAPELEVGLLSASVPVRDGSGAIVAALASWTSSGRSDPERLAREVVPLLVQTAERISADLGHRAGTTRRSVVLEGRDGFF